MRILLLSWRGPEHPNAGGAETSTHEHAKGWVKAGNEVTLFTSSYIGAKKEEDIDGVKIIRRGRQVLGVHWEAFKWYLFDKHDDFDLVVDQFHGIPFFTPLFVRKKKLGFIHEATKEVWSLNPWPKPFNLIPTIFGTISEPLIFKFFYRKIPFMTVSESTAKDLFDWGILKDNITIVHNGISVPKIGRLPTKEKKKTAIFLGAISRDKGIEDALRVFAYIDKKEKGWQFWIVGRSESKYLNFLKKQAKDLGITNKVKFWGYVTENKKYELLARAHVLINPSIREGWGLVVTEAASVGTPTIAYDVPGLRDSIRDGITGFLCEERNPTLLAENILKLLSNKKNYIKICDNAKDWSKEFSWKKTARESLKLLEKIVK